MALSEIAAQPEQDHAFLDALAEYGEKEMERHVAERKDWAYHDILTREAMAERVVAPPVDASPEIQAIFLGNLAVEKGHAEYDRVLAGRLQVHPVFKRWKDMWVAEEEPHGAAMQEWAKVAGLFGAGPEGVAGMHKVHDTIAGYLKAGLTLSFDDAAMAFAYPAFQEPATRVTHREVKNRLPESEKEGRRLLSRIIADEERHERFYCNMVRHALHSGDVTIASHQMCGIARSTLGFAMPGIETDIPGGDEITKAYRRTGAFTAGKVATEVLRPLIKDDGAHGWRIADVETLDDRGRAAQEAVLQLDADLAAVEGNDRRTLVVLGRARAALAAAA